MSNTCPDPGPDPNLGRRPGLTAKSDAAAVITLETGPKPFPRAGARTGGRGGPETRATDGRQAYGDM